MVEMPVAEDQRIHLRRVDLHDLQVVGIGLGGEAEIQQIATCFPAPLGFDVQRQAPLAVERFARRSIGTSALHGKAGLFGTAQKDIVRAVGHLLHNDPVDRRHLDARRRGGRPTDPRGQQRAAHRSRGLEKTPPIQRRHAGLPVNYPLCARAREISSDIPEPRPRRTRLSRSSVINIASRRQRAHARQRRSGNSGSSCCTLTMMPLRGGPSLVDEHQVVGMDQAPAGAR